MTKKDYIAIAKVISNARYFSHTTNACNRIATDLADLMAKDNANFNRERFLLACGVSPG